MKKIVLGILMVVFVSNSYSQKLVENKIDEFTKESIKRTNWDIMYTDMGGFVLRYRLSKINNYYFVELKIFASGDFIIIPKDSDFMLKKSNDDIVTLKSINNESSCIGCGAIGLVASEAYGIWSKYSINLDEINKLKTDKIIKIRLYTDKAYYDKEININKSEKFIKHLELITGG